MVNVYLRQYIFSHDAVPDLGHVECISDFKKPASFEPWRCRASRAGKAEQRWTSGLPNPFFNAYFDA